MARTLSLALAALISTVMATPMPTPAPAKQEVLAVHKMTTIVVEETRLPVVDDVPYATWAPEFLPITIINSHHNPISTSHAYNPGPTPVGGKPEPGTMRPGETATFAVPTGWGGNVAVVDSRYPIAWMGGDTLIESSFVVPWGSNGIAVADINISYVTGFSLPSTCWCDQSRTVLTGCNLDLFAVAASTGNQCPPPDNLLDTYGLCNNPLRGDLNARDATPFFKPCQGLGYTFPSDDRANSFGFCQAGITCCVGTSCPPHPRQPF
ncbi:hypothetical protein DL765_008684 [Monosporascus sp. GIB2]|nr:hypothetical protein DL765_008684 [Monosporascus sp. GIB2]